MTPPGPTPVTTTPTVEQLAAGCRSLRRLVASMACLLLLGSLGTNLFMLRHISLARTQAAELRKDFEEFQNRNAPVIDQFVAELQTFATTNADFAPVLAQFRIGVRQAPGLPLPSAKPPPGR